MSPTSKDKEKDKEKDPEMDPTWFLVNCIMHSEAGKLEKINWGAIAEKLNIKTKGAASMRYQRLLNSYGLTSAYTPKTTQATGSAPAGDSAAPEPNTPVPKRKSNKRKRQAEPQDDAENAGNAGEKE